MTVKQSIIAAFRQMLHKRDQVFNVISSHKISVLVYLSFNRCVYRWYYILSYNNFNKMFKVTWYPFKEHFLDGNQLRKSVNKTLKKSRK